jgi:two-component system cell cycle response regulator
MSLRIKLMLAMLLTGLSTVAMVGGLAYLGVAHKVDEIRRQQAAEHFYRNMSGYLQQYGSWEAATRAEGFDSYAQRMDRQRHQEALAAGETPQAPLDGERQRGDGPPPGEGRGDDQRPPPPEDGPRGEGPPDGGPPRPDNAGPDDRRPPPPRGPGRNEPPFHFIVADENFRVLLGAGAYRRGELLPASARKNAQPIEVNHHVAAYVSPEGIFTPSKQEQQYLAAMRDALIAGAAAATALALLLGVLLSQGLSRTLSRLTQAVRAMHRGSLLQRVPVQGKDEIATLAMAFNDMSEKLARSHEELNQSHQTILAQAEQLRELSVRDALTNLYNRRHFDEQATTLFNSAVRHKRPLSLVIGDIDFFKRINDQFSHATGDAVLRQVGEILRSHMRLSDLVARYGGEEFVIALPETALPQAAALCDKLRNMIEGFPWHQVHPDLKVTMSMGVYADLAAGTAEAMLQKADALLYRAKETGRNRVCFMEAMV